MKTNYIYVTAVALAMMATGCSDDQLVQTQEPALQGHQVRVNASMTPQSRLGITDTGTRLEYTWEADDAFHIFDPTNNQTTLFTKETEENEEASPMAAFVGTPETAYLEGSKLYAVYTNQQDSLVLDENGNVTLDISNQTGRLDEKFQYMFAESVFTEAEDPAFAFQHLVTMLKVNITVPEGVESLKEIHLSCNGMPTKATLVLTKAPYDAYEMFKPGDLVSCYNYKSSVSELVIEGEFVPVDGVVTAYMYVFPVHEYNENHNWYNNFGLTPAIWTVDHSGNQHVGISAFDYKEIVAGKTYQLNTETYTLVPFANEETANGSEVNPYEIATAEQLYSFMYRTSRNMQNKYGRRYNNCHYKLTDDIKLNDEQPWISTYLYSGGFDGQGHTIAGNIQMHVDYQTGFFSNVSNSIIQNLNLDLNVTFDNEWNQEWFGMLAGEIYDNSQVINCTNHSNISGKFYRMAGLVGILGWNSSIIACGNTGTLTAQEENRQMGGIVALMDDNSTLEGCYNTGTFSVNTVYHDGLQVGGIAGTMHESSNITLQNCWSNATLTIENVVYDDHYVNETNNIFMGGMVGYQSNGSIANCYWNEAVENAVGYQGGTVSDFGTFAESIPTAEQFSLMNASLSSKGWQFNAEDGTLKQSTSIIVPSLPKEEW